MIGRLAAALTAKPRAELAWLAGATAVAALSAGFAGYMLALGEHEPRINGMQYLAIFAQPRRAPVSEGAPAPAAAIDAAPIGSIAPASRAERSATYGPPEVVAATPERAWVRVRDTIRSVVPGDAVEGIGRVAAIGEREGTWTLLDARGAALLRRRAASVPADRGAPFSRSLIFEPSR